MESKIKLFGHPVHPLLIVLPLGLLIGSIIFDTIFVFTKHPLLPGVSFFNISLGIIGGLVAAIFGFVDWNAIPSQTRAKRVGAWHGVGNVVVVVLFAVSWWLRMIQPGLIPSTLALTFSYAAILLGVVTAWLGGELVFRLNVGPDRDASLNASNSLLTNPQNNTSGKVGVGHQIK